MASLCSGQTSNGMTRNNHPPYNINAVDNEYVDIEMSSFPQSTDFEFQMTSIFTDKELTTFPADDLFYKGKLLPLLLPPRLQITQNLLPTTNVTTKENNSIEEEDFIIMDFASSTSPFKNTSTPPKSCRLSFELNPDDYFERSTCLTTFISKHPEKSWSNKLRLIKKSLISNRQKASRACRRLLFRKSACKEVSSAKAPDYNPGTDKQVTDGKGFLLKSMKVEHKKTPFGHIGMWRHPILDRVIKKIHKEGIEDRACNHRWSLSYSSAEIKRYLPIKCLAPRSSGASCSFFSSSSSSSVSFSSSDFYELNFHRRSYGVISEIDGPIEAAIAHCKKSQELPNPRKIFSEAGHFELSAPKIGTKFKSEYN